MPICRPGDMAEVVKSDCHNQGMYIVIEGFHGQIIQGLDVAIWWDIDTPLMFTDGIPRKLARDDWLRPHRPGPGDSEELRWAGKPKPIVKPAKREKLPCMIDRMRQLG